MTRFTFSYARKASKYSAVVLALWAGFAFLGAASAKADNLWQASNGNVVGNSVQFDYRGGTATYITNVADGSTISVVVDNTIANCIGTCTPTPDEWRVSINGETFSGNTIGVTTVSAVASGQVVISVYGKDIGFWGGWYGPIFYAPSVVVPATVVPVIQDTSTSIVETQTPQVPQETVTVVVPDTSTAVPDTQTSIVESPTATAPSDSLTVPSTDTQTLTSESSTQTIPSETSTLPIETPLPTQPPVVEPQPIPAPVAVEPQPLPQPLPEPSVPVVQSPVETVQPSVPEVPEAAPEIVPPSEPEAPEAPPLAEPAPEEKPVAEEPPPVEEPSAPPVEEDTNEIPVEPLPQEPLEPTPAPSPLPVAEPVPVIQPDIAYVPPSNSEPMVTLDNGVVITEEEAAAVVLLSNPAELISELFSDPGAVFSALGSVGADMTPEVREKSEKVILASVIAGNIATQAAATAGAVAAYRRKP